LHITFNLKRPNIWWRGDSEHFLHPTHTFILVNISSAVGQLDLSYDSHIR